MLIHWIWFSCLHQVTSRQKCSLLQQFRDPEEIYRAGEDALSAVAGMTEKAMESLNDKDLAYARQILARCGEKRISILTYGDSAYPKNLRNIEQPPFVLYYKGCLPDWDSMPVIGIVGTRKASAYGQQTAKDLGYQIASCGGLVVSGGADGIDTQALVGALEAGKKTVAVLGCGADVIYPAKNRELFEKIEKCGCLLTEFVPGTPPNSWNFPQRNRILSGMSSGVVVVEAPERSGALNTVNHAADQGRDVFVVPGNVNNPCCAGSNRLLRERAIPVLEGWDVVREYAPLYPNTATRFNGTCPVQPEQKNTDSKPIPGKKVIDNPVKSRYSVEEKEPFRGTPEEELVLKFVETDPKPVDEIIAAAGLPAGKVLSVLTLLAMKGQVINHPGKRVSLK